MTIPTFSIKSKEDINDFFSWLIGKDMLIHPDDSFHFIIDFAEDENENPCITREQANYLDEVMEKCVEWCEENNEDIYEVAMWNTNQ